MTYGIVFQPRSSAAFLRGVHHIADAVAPTLGALPRYVAIAGTGNAPELLDCGALIARRIIQLPDRDEDVGAMFTRGLLWRLYERCGDGTATAAVLFRALMDGGARALAAGMDAARLRGLIEARRDEVVGHLRAVTTPCGDERRLIRLAERLCADRVLAALLGEAFDVVGAFGALELRGGQTAHDEFESISGTTWASSPLTPAAISGGSRRQIELPRILISDLELTDPAALVDWLRRMRRAEVGGLLIVAASVNADVTALLNANDHPLRALVAVQTPGANASAQAAHLNDLALLTGGRAVLRASGETLASVQPSDLGQARSAWATAVAFGIQGGSGDPRLIRSTLRRLRAAYTQTVDVDAQERLHQRMAALLGGAAVLWIGGATANEIKARKAAAERASKALRGALLTGVLPGGGSALLAASARLAVPDAADPEARGAFAMTTAALEAPFRALLANAGMDAEPALSAVRAADGRCAFDVTTRTLVDPHDASLLDPAQVLIGAVESAFSGAAQALTIAVHIHRREPPTELNP